MSQTTTLDLDGYPETLTTHDLAKVLRVHVKTLARMIVAGQLPTSRKIGGQHRWGRDEIRAWWDAGCPSQSEWAERAEKTNPRRR